MRRVPHVRAAVAAAAVLTLASGWLLPPLHVHMQSGDDGHRSRVLVHQHVAPHHETSGREFESRNRDDRTVWLLDQPFVASEAATPSRISPAILIFSDPQIHARDDRFCVHWAVALSAPPHGPPRQPKSLRAPPLPA